ncbi:MAG: glycosyltransferase [Betaproteobacteria bacterium]
MISQDFAANARAPAGLRLIVVASEFPYPPVHGGRTDVWRRLCGLRSLGVRLQLLTWYVEAEGPPSPEDVAAVRAVVEDVHVFPVSVRPAALLLRLLALPWYPSHASARILPGRHWATVARILGSFRPNAVLLDGLYGYAVAAKLAGTFGLPLLLRSHNIEHFYMARQARFARSAKARFALSLATIGLRRFERGVLRRCSWVYDISLSDMEHWRRDGVSRISWLPPIVQVPGPDDGGVARSFDIVFLGNLHRPNNVQSVRWLIADILPRIKARLGAVSLCVAGSNPTAEILELCRGLGGVELIANPVSPWPLYRAARVLVNPATSGSGVQIKTVEMLHFQAPVVSTSVGAQGLPEDVKALMSIADNTEDFAEAVVAALRGPVRGPDARFGPLRIFGVEQLGEMVARIAMSGDCARAGHG